jgi:putative pyruvate formate lyase activating enzyme
LDWQIHEQKLCQVGRSCGLHFLALLVPADIIPGRGAIVDAFSMLTQAIGTEQLVAARTHYRRCMLCEHRCGVDRIDGGRGFCQANNIARVYRHRVEYGEELELVPSHLFYLSGCDLKCGFCIGGAAAGDPRYGQPLTGEYLAEALAWGRQHGARNIQWVGGEPTIHLPAILDAMAECGELPPVVWKSNFHATPEAMKLLEGVVDVYVADFKFGDNSCAKRISGATDYLEIITRNLLIADRQGDLIVRHLLLPGHFDCCFRPVVLWIKRFLPTAKFSIRGGYMPSWKAGEFSELTAPLDPKISDQAHALAAEAGLNVII